jgi:NAD(P)H-dependent FMN reductase
MIHASPVLVIAGTIRPQRISPQVAAWVADHGAAFTQRPIEQIDLQDWPLPMDDKPAMPQTGVYANDHTQAWSRKIAEAAGFIFVTPQYNRGYPAPLKNALDHLYREWTGKPAMIVTYGGHGGGHCAAQLKVVFEGLRMTPIVAGPQLILPRDTVEANAGHVDPSEQFAAHVEDLRTALAQFAKAVDA